jgi:hypothetical protein
MSKASIGQRAQRVVGFLMGVRNPRAATALAAHGFTEADLRKGLSHLARVVRLRLGEQVPVENPRVIKELEAFQKRWLGIARLTLENEYPAVAQKFFMNLTPLEGAQVTASMTTFLERFAALEGATNDYGPEAPAARALLGKRGLTPERVAQAQALVDELGTLQVLDVDGEAYAADEQAAEDAMWAWYRQWGGIARLAISDRRILRGMGFLRSRKGSVEEVDPTADDGTTEPATTVVTAPQLPPVQAPQLASGEPTQHDDSAAITAVGITAPAQAAEPASSVAA